MKIKKLWIELENDNGETLLRPATADDLEYLKYRPNPGTEPKQPEPAALKDLQDLDCQTWEVGPGYSREEIEALRLQPGELYQSGKK